MAWYNYTHRDGTTDVEMLLSRNSTKIGTVHDFSLYRTAQCSASGACYGIACVFSSTVTNKLGDPKFRFPYLICLQL